MNNMKLTICLIIALGLSACATPTTMSPQGSTAEIDTEARLQQEMAFKNSLKEDRRVQHISYKIQKANASLCSNAKYSLGINAWNEHSIPKNRRDTGHLLYNIGEVAQIKTVFKNSPASKNGIKVNDRIIAINDTEIPTGKYAITKFIKALEKAEEPTIKMTINRNGTEITKNITRNKTCGYGVVYQENDTKINASADGKNIYIPRGMIRFVEGDRELALVISHEIAHNAMGHSDKKRKNAMGAGAGGLALDILAAVAGVNTNGAFTDAAMKAGGQAYSVEFEQEADYVGMYFMERAGYKSGNAANFWRRMAAENNSANIKTRSSHPATSERFVSIKKTYKEIQSKKKSGKKLTPEINEELLKKTNMSTGKTSGYNG